MNNQILMWVGFNLLVLVLLALDLGVFHKKTHAVGVKEALSWSAFWIALALMFNVFIYYQFGIEEGSEYLTGYLLEKSLSVDNLFVIVLVFNYFQVPQKYQHKVLFWGILGALVMRGSLIVVGSALITKFHWILYIFGVFLVFTGIKMALSNEDDEIEPERNPVIKLFKKFIPVTDTFHEDHFFVRLDKRLFATPLFIALIVVEMTDLIFAVDSIPAIFSVTQKPFIIYTSNVFAILGLRSLYFALSAIVDKFHYLQLGLSIILTLIGLKMLGSHFYHPPSWLTLVLVIAILGLSVLASIIWPPREETSEKEVEIAG